MGIINYELLCRNVIYVHIRATRYADVFARVHVHAGAIETFLCAYAHPGMNDYLARTVTRS